MNENWESSFKIAQQAIKEAADYPWNKCIQDQTNDQKSSESAKKICGSIKAKNN